MPLTAPGPPRTGFVPLRITAVRPETADALSLTMEVPEPDRPRFAFAPGQYLTLRTRLQGEEVRRCYSICAGLDEGALRVAIKRVEGGRFSGWAHGALAPGQTIEAMPPAGRFVVRPDPAARRTILAVAAGSGITPVLSIVASVLAREPQSRVLLVYGSRSTGDILFREALEALKDRHLARFALIHVLSRERQDIPVLNGRIDGAKVAALLPRLLPGRLPDLALLCGPGGMIRSVAEALQGLGMDPAHILNERFVPDGEVAPTPRPPRSAPTRTAPTRAATIISDGTATEVPLADGETVLDAGLRAGLDLPYSCHGGMCSTCRARLTEGEVAMDVNFGLEPWETAAGYVLTCQSHPTTAHVTIDYDHV